MSQFSSSRSGAIVVFGALALAACSDGSGPASPTLTDLPISASVVAPVNLRHVVRVNPGYAYCTTPMDVNGDNVGDVQYDFGFKVAAGSTDAAGTYQVPGMGSITVSTNDGITWSWTSTFGIDAVISKGGNEHGHLYMYDGERTSDDDLYSGTNDNGQRQAISHLHFCFDLELDVAKTAETTFTRDYDWSITKTAAPSVRWSDQNGDGTDDAGYLKINSGSEAGVAYTVAVANAGYRDRNYAVSGKITLSNPTPAPAEVTSLEDVLSGFGSVAHSCTLPKTLAPGATLECAYSTALPNAEARTNTATAVTNAAIGYTAGATADADGNVFYGSGSVAGDSGVAAVTFGEPTDLVDESVTVSDSYGEFGAARTVGLSGGSFPYTKSFGGTTCGSYQSTNTASFAAESGEHGSAEVTVSYDVVGCGEPPIGVCTLTQGYWKTHSAHGPAPKTDATWLLVGGPDALFMQSASSWYNLFQTSPRGDAYIILAHQYMAATLNGLKGADTSAVSAALARAQALLANKRPGGIKGADANTAKELAAMLDAYNNGLTGPGHCSDAPQG